jgi:hypothetical protein
MRFIIISVLAIGVNLQGCSKNDTTTSLEDNSGESSANSQGREDLTGDGSLGGRSGSVTTKEGENRPVASSPVIRDRPLITPHGDTSDKSVPDQDNESQEDTSDESVAEEDNGQQIPEVSDPGKKAQIAEHRNENTAEEELSENMEQSLTKEEGSSQTIGPKKTGFKKEVYDLIKARRDERRAKVAAQESENGQGTTGAKEELEQVLSRWKARAEQGSV